MDNLIHNPWRWYYGFGHAPDCERYFAADSREQAISTAEQDCIPGDPYCIGEARFAEPSFKIFDADRVLGWFGEANEECWGEDGPEIETTAEQDADLEAMLTAAFTAWAEKHGRPWRVWSLEEWRNTEDRAAIAKAQPEQGGR